MKSVADIEQFERWELEAFAEGIDMPHVRLFSEQNPDIWFSWLKSYRQEQSKFAVLCRFDCPDPDELRDYHWKILKSDKLVTIQAHLKICLSCTDELQDLKTSLEVSDELSGDLSAEKFIMAPLQDLVEEVIQQLRWTVATLVNPSSTSFSPMALRNDVGIPPIDVSHRITMLFETSQHDLDILIQKEEDGTITLTGQILTAASLVDAQVKLFSADIKFTSVQKFVNNAGEFTVEKLVAGTYQLLIVLSDEVIAIPNLILKG